MKHLVCLCAPLLVGLAGVCQEPAPATKTVEAGMNSVTHQPLTATAYTFKNRIQSVQFDSARSIALIKFRELTKNQRFLKPKGAVSVNEVPGFKTLWVKDVNFNLQTIRKAGGQYFEINNNRQSLLDIRTGTKKWEADNAVLYVNEKTGVVLGYDFNDLGGKYSNKLQGLSYTNGSNLWSRQIKRDYGWNEVVVVNDSVIIILAAGLHELNLRTGKGWDHELVTGKKNRTSQILSGLAAVASGIATGTAFITNTDPDIISEIVSNTVQEDTLLYVASRENLLKISRNGAVLWQTPLEKDQTSTARIWVRQDTVFHLNFGYARFNGATNTTGTPFLAAYDKKTGRPFYSIEIGGKKDVVKSFGIVDDSSAVLVLLGKDLFLYDLSEGVKKCAKIYGPDKAGAPYTLGLSDLFVLQDSVFKGTEAVFRYRYRYMTDSLQFVFLNGQLERVGHLPADQVYTVYKKGAGYTIFNAKKGYCVADKNMRIIARLDLDGDLFVFGDQLYAVRENSILVTDLKTVLATAP